MARSLTNDLLVGIHPFTHEFLMWTLPILDLDMFRIGNGQILSLFDNYLPATRPYFRFLMITCINFNRFYSNFVYALILWRVRYCKLACQSKIKNRIPNSESLNFYCI